jgi:proteasome lid subunit RPN8/RPN11
MRFLASDVIEAARLHAMHDYPNESCGAVIEKGYLPLCNLSAEPTKKFDCEGQVEALVKSGRLIALIHSHPDGPLSPSIRDMEQQIVMDIPWGIVMCSATAALPPWFWGPGVPIPPLVERDFRYGPSGSDGKGDCAALVRDWYQIERGIELPEFPRAKGCWHGKPDLYRENLLSAGFTRTSGSLSMEEPCIGDVFLMAYHSRAPNHVALYQGRGMILHHLEQRLSRVEPFSAWRQFVTDVFRHE